MKISVVVPVYKTKDAIFELYERVSKELNSLTNDWELLLVDDCSDDGTYFHLLNLREKDKRVKVILFSHNQGQHAATLCGIQRSTGDYVFTMDDDLQNPPEEMSKFIERVNQGFDLVIGKISGKKQHSTVRNILSTIVQILIHKILGKPKQISLSSYRCMTKRAAQLMGSFNGKQVYLPAIMFRSVPSSRIANVDVSHHSRRLGKSQYSLMKLIHLFSFLVINYSKLPLRLVSLWGLVVSGISLFFALYVIVRVILFGSSTQGWPSLAVLITFLSGTILLCVGILGEYLGRILEERAVSQQFTIFEEHTNEG